MALAMLMCVCAAGVWAADSAPTSGGEAPQAQQADEEPVAVTALPARVKLRLTPALETLASDSSAAAANEVLAAMNDTGLTDAAWRTFFEEHFKAHAFTEPLARFWEHALPLSNRAAYLSAVSACEALGGGFSHLIAKDPALDAAAMQAAAAWLARTAPLLTPEERQAIRARLSELASGEALNIVSLWRDPSAAGGAHARLAMQLCFTMAAYAERDGQGRQALPVELGQAPDAEIFWRSRGVFLFDNGALHPAQLRSLDSVVAGIPPQLLPLSAVVAPEAAGVNPARPGVLAPYAFLPVVPIPMDVWTDPAAFGLGPGGPSAPEFPVSVGIEIVRMVQPVQFSRRPTLVARRDALVARTTRKRVLFPRRDVPQAVYADRPDELLPLTAYLWFVDSTAAFRMALDFVRAREYEAMETLFLLADLLSAGGNTTLLFSCGPDGVMRSWETPIGRTLAGEIPVGANGTAPFNPLNSIGIDGDYWTFFLNETGGMTASYRRAGAPQL
ncbi:MAG: hypothetical protein GWP08_05390 [Nitrospiraceae bacterium]|nr:hypothetical protein [Nitrospiraceae bacterium]